MSKATFNMTLPFNRLHGSMPKIGIRPVIDAREKGVRESLEIQTMQMAEAAAKFISENLDMPTVCRLNV